MLEGTFNALSKLLLIEVPFEVSIEFLAITNFCPYLYHCTLGSYQTAVQTTQSHNTWQQLPPSTVLSTNYMRFLPLNIFEMYLISIFLPPAYEVRGKVMFWHESVCLSTLVGEGGPGGTTSQV